jgi:hypothetical protein
VAGVGLLHGIHGKSADGIDAGLIELFVCHHGPLCRGVCLMRRLSLVVLSTNYVGRIEHRLERRAAGSDR